MASLVTSMRDDEDTLHARRYRLALLGRRPERCGAAVTEQR